MPRAPVRGFIQDIVGMARRVVVGAFGGDDVLPMEMCRAREPEEDC